MAVRRIKAQADEHLLGSAKIIAPRATYWLALSSGHFVQRDVLAVGRRPKPC
jgi:hypothetical protein